MRWPLNFTGKFQFSHFGTDTHSGIDLAAGEAPATGHTVVVPDASLLFSGDYKRAGVDLVLSKDGHDYVVQDYFKGSARATLASPDGANLSGDLVTLLTGEVQLAQLGGATAAAQVIGTVTKLTGSATAIRNGVSVMLNIGDNVQKGDVVQAGADSALGLTFVDGTVFGLSANARMVLNEMVYDPNGSANSSLLSLVQGTITFVAGETAKHGDMRVDTPVATMGIRGTAVLVEIGFEVPGQGGAPPVKFQVLVEPNGAIGSYVLYSKTSGQVIGTVNAAGQVTSVLGNGDTTTGQADPLSPMAQAIIQQTLQQYFPNYSPNPRSNGAGGSTPANPLDDRIDKLPNLTIDEPNLVPIKFPGNNNGSDASTTLFVTIIPRNTAPTIDVSPVVVTLPVGNTHFKLSDQVTINDPDATNPVFNDVAVPYVPGTGHITAATGPAQGPSGAALASLVAVDPQTGVVSYDPAAFKFLAAGQSAVYTIAFDSRSGPDTVHETLTFTVDGVNDTPVVAAPLASTATQGGAAQAIDLLAGATDPDAGETASLSVTNIRYAIDGHAASATAPAGVTLNGTVLSVDPTNPAYGHLAAGATTQIVVSYDVTDVHGATVTQTETITITGVNDAPTVVAALTTAALQGDVLRTVNLLAGAADPDDGETAGLSITNIRYAIDGHAASATAPAGFNLTGGTLSIDPANPAYAHLAAGATTQIKVTYDITDVHGAAVTQTETITITGINDSPTVAAALTTAALQGDVLQTVNLLAGAADPDDGETAGLSITNIQYAIDGHAASATKPAGFSLNGGTLSIDPANPAYAHLAAGATTQIIVSYDITDAHGATVAQTETITITGNSSPLTAIWTGAAGDGKWDTAGNWDPRAPTAIDKVSFTDDAVVTLSSDIVIAGLIVAACSVVDITTDNASNAHSIDVAGTLNNLGDIVLHAGTTLEVTGSVENAGIIRVDTYHPVGATLLIDGTATLEGGGTVTLDGTADKIAGTPGAKLINHDNTIDGYGTVGNGHLDITNNCDGSIVADTAHKLVVDVRFADFINYGTIKSDGSGGLEILGDLENHGTLDTHRGVLDIDGDLTGHGLAVIDGGTLEFGGRSDAHVQFSGSSSDELVLDRGSHFTGSVSGLSYGDAIDLQGISPWQLNIQQHNGVVEARYGWGANDYFTLTDPGVLNHLELSSDHHGGTELVWNNDAPELDTSSVHLTKNSHGYYTISGVSASDGDSSPGEIYRLAIDGQTDRTGSLSALDHSLENGFDVTPTSIAGQATVGATLTDSFGASDHVNFIFNTAPLNSNTQVTLTGTGQNDVIFATDNKDILTGGHGADQFVFGPHSGSSDRDIITDFQVGVDKIELDHIRGVPALSGPFAEVQLFLWELSGGIQQRGNDTLIHLAGGDTLQLDGVHMASLHASDFIVHPYGNVS